jgi:hypothetical protein
VHLVFLESVMVPLLDLMSAHETSYFWNNGKFIFGRIVFAIG